MGKRRRGEIDNHAFGCMLKNKGDPLETSKVNILILSVLSPCTVNLISIVRGPTEGPHKDILFCGTLYACKSWTILIFRGPLSFEFITTSSLSYSLINLPEFLIWWNASIKTKFGRAEKFLLKTSLASPSLGNKTSGFSADEEIDKLPANCFLYRFLNVFENSPLCNSFLGLCCKHISVWPWIMPALCHHERI